MLWVSFFLCFLNRKFLIAFHVHPGQILIYGPKFNTHKNKKKNGNTRHQKNIKTQIKYEIKMCIVWSTSTLWKLLNVWYSNQP